ncbi:MAG: transketolase [Gammaproteobacteria bacterium]|nr:MAG: transketolase [Gammaproteobacteria bacterium]
MPNSTQLADVIRIISMDAVENAGCGHPGMPMGMADIAEVLWRLHLNHNPNNPDWVNRDRFILSNGHGSMLIYSLLHLTGYALSMDEIKNFRQLGSKTPGHPEYGVTPGVETTTGPLGQGLANGVGMALAEKILSRRFNKDDISLIDHKTYVFAGDGCLMEGISHEACSLAGTLKLGKLIVFYDNNNISIDGEVSGWFTEDIPKRFESYGWQVISGVDGHDPDQINKAIEEAKQESEKPTLIDCKTIIGKGSPNKEGSASSHGSALGSEESKKVREKLRWTYPPFEIPREIYREWDSKEIGEKKEKKWNELFTNYKKAYPELSNELNRVISGNLFNNFEEKFDQFISDLQTKQEDIATRKSSELVLNYLGPLLPELLGGSADLSGSNNTKWQGTKAIEGNGEDGNYINYGVREFAMSAIVNGLVLHGGLKPYAGTFLTFLDYAKNAVRMSALMKIPSIFVYSHDSIGVGEDGPTHQPIEHLSSLRSMPNVETWRPCDSVETAATWKSALLNKDKPTAIILSRQNLRAQSRTAKQIDKIYRGGYVLYEPKEKPDLIIISTGSEIGLAMEVMEELKEEKNIRVVSMPCTERFDAQEDDYKKEVLLEDIPIISIEASHGDWWNKYVDKTGVIVGMNDFGESAPGDDLQKHFGFTTKNILNIINSL